MSSAQLHSNPKISQGGQGIIEVIVTIGIGTIMILALVVLSVRTNRSSDFSKASSQASSLAAEGIEIINNLKEMNGTDTVPTPDKLLFRYNGPEITCAGTANASDEVSWDFLFTKNLDDAACGSNPGRVGYIVPSGLCTGTTNNCIYFSDDATSSSYGSIKVDSRIYTRQVFIADTPAPLIGTGKSNCNVNASDWNLIKQFTVVVSWTDSSGTHNQTQVACYQR